MAAQLDGELDSPIRVVITPSQSAYYAGEPFTVTITFTNTRTVEDSGPARSGRPSFSHKRNAHSISSAPLAKPPTSPGIPSASVTPRTAGRSSSPFGVAASRRVPGGSLKRRGLVGAGVTLDAEDASSGDAASEGADPVHSRRRAAGRSLSVDITPRASEPPRGDYEVSPNSPIMVQRALGMPMPSSPRISSPLARSSPISPSHPHARKSSIAVADLQQVLNGAPGRGPPNSGRRTPSLPPTPNTASTPSFPVALDAIVEVNSPPPPSPGQFVPSPAPPPANFEDPALRLPPMQAPQLMPAPPKRSHSQSDASSGRRPANLGVGSGPGFASAATRSASASNIPSAATTPTSGLTPTAAAPRVASASFVQSQAEVILYAYAQLVGTLALAPTSAAVGAPAPGLLTLRRQLRAAQAVGGGRMDLALSTQAPAPSAVAARRSATHGRTGSILGIFSPAALLGGGGPTQPVSPGSPRRMRSASAHSLSALSEPARVGLGITAGAPGASTPNLGVHVPPHSARPYYDAAGAAGAPEDEGVPLPVFGVQPSMLAVDLALAPGEARSYTYTIALPPNLPPTFGGRSMAFAYEFVVGTCRAGGAAAPGSAKPGTPSLKATGSSSQVMKVPIRVYNHVTVDMPPQPYDFLWPLAQRRGPPTVARVAESTTAATPDRSASAAKAPDPVSEHALGPLVKQLLASPTNLATPPFLMSSHDQEDEHFGANDAVATSNGEAAREDEGTLTGCREAVEILTRNLKKASYDINKDGINVAVLTFAKSAYRLGETVLGVVELNEREGRARVLKMSALLEAHESLPDAIDPPAGPASKPPRRVHAEHHSSFVQSTLRTTFSLDIPSDASPSFFVEFGGAESASLGGLDWKVRLSLLVAVASESAVRGTGGAYTKHLVRDGPTGEWGGAWRAPRGAAPLVQGDPADPADARPTQSWSSWAASLLSGPDDEDGTANGAEAPEDEDDEVGGGDAGWRELRVERVECEVPIRVWPGNTAFKAMEVVFDV